jgi:dUTP pyrophosphatase
MVKEIEYYLIDKSLPKLIWDEENSGIDLYSRVNCFIPPSFSSSENGFVGVDFNNLKLVPLNVIVKGNIREHCLVFPRSSLFKKKGLMLWNNVGVIDPSYQGIDDEIKAGFLNFTNSSVRIKKGERLCQMILFPNKHIIPVFKNEHWGSDVRGGFGSTEGYFEDETFNIC